MMHSATGYNSGTGHSQSLWPVLVVLLLTVVVPAGCVLWFMAAAMRSESLAVRQRLRDVYRERMESAKKDLDERWASMLRAVWADRPGLSPSSCFAAVVSDQMAQSYVLPGSGEVAGYPSGPWTVPENLPDGQPLWDKAVTLESENGQLPAAAEAFGEFAEMAQSASHRAQALQSQARCLLRLGDRRRTLVVLLDLIARDDLKNAADASGRLIVPAAQLLALRVMTGPDAPRYAEVRRDLIERLKDYAAPMPAGQRRFLMHSLVELGASPQAWGPLLAAEDLAAEYLAVEQPSPDRERLSGTKTPGVWHIGSADRIALYRETWIVDRFRDVLAEHESAGMSLVLCPAESRGTQREPFLSTWATNYLPGWTLEVRLAGADPFVAEAGRQRALYLWTGGVGVVLIAVLAAAVAGLVSRQIRLTRLKNDLIATVSHELKTPLASMRMLVDTLLEGRYHDQQQVTDYLQMIARENQRLSRLIDNFLTFSRMERNKRAFVFAAVRIDQVVARAVEAVAERFRMPGCQLEVDVPADLPAVRGDMDALTTVVLNLLDNAWKYTGQAKQVSIRGRALGERVVVEVKDNGAGIPRRAQRRIFERFYQVDRRLSRQAGGCGLGLSIVQFIVAAHGGTIAVVSEVGKGSVFTVTLPVARSGESPQEQA